MSSFVYRVTLVPKFSNPFALYDSTRVGEYPSYSEMTKDLFPKILYMVAHDPVFYAEILKDITVWEEGTVDPYLFFKIEKVAMNPPTKLKPMSSKDFAMFRESHKDIIAFENAKRALNKLKGSKAPFSCSRVLVFDEDVGNKRIKQ